MMRRAALWYARRNFAVFPLRERTKIPLLQGGRGYLDATDDEDQVRRWWTEHPTANIGISCVASGIVVIDVDPRNGGDETFARIERESGPLPRTWTVLTPSGGQHYYFRCSDRNARFVGSMGPGLDVKWHGYVAAPPSIHPNGGTYVFDVGAHPTDTEIVGFALPAPRPANDVRHESSGIDALNSYLGVAFETANWLGDPLPGGRRAVRCPWHHLHTDGRGGGKDSSTVIFPHAAGHTLGGFRCAHGHCEGRTWKDVLDALPSSARWAADKAMAAARRRAREGVS